MIARIRRQVRPQRVAMRLIPERDVIAEGHGFLSTGSAPAFRIEPVGRAWPRGWCLMECRAVSHTMRISVDLRPDTGMGFAEKTGLPLGPLPDGDVSVPVYLPAGLRAMRLEPGRMAGLFALTNLRFRELSSLPRLPSALAAVARGREAVFARLRPREVSQNYPEWLRRYGRLTGEDVAILRRALDAVPPPRIIVYAPDRRDALAALTDQTYPKIAFAEDVTEPHLFDLLLPIAPGDRLAPGALELLAYNLMHDVPAALVFADEDCGEKPWFKTGWSTEAMRGRNSVGRPWMVIRAAARACGADLAAMDADAEHAFLLRLAEMLGPHSIRHEPRVLLHRDRPRLPAMRPVATIQGDLDRSEPGATAFPLSDRGVRVVYPTPATPPRVTVIVPTRDQPMLLARCLDAVLARTEYPDLEVVVVDNRSAETATHDLFRRVSTDARVRVLTYDAPFNYAAMNNRAVAAAGGSVVCLLNNDIDVLQADWLTEMVSHAIRPTVGAVGAKLLYGDGTVQHAGVVTGIGGVAGHVLRGAPGDAPGPRGRLALTQDVTAVTAACMVLRRAVFRDMGGFDVTRFPVSYNDVDFCLRLREAGFSVVWTPFATLLHLESVSRGADTDSDNRARAVRERDAMLRQWGDRLVADPFYSANLTLSDETMTLAFPPRLTRPWLVQELFGGTER